MARRNPYISLPLLAALMILAGCEQSAPTVESGPRPVKSMTVRTVQSLGLSFPGVVQARIETDLAFRTLGRVISRKVDVGALVHKDDIVAEIDPLALRLAVASAEAELRNAQAQLENAAITEKRRRMLASTSAGTVADLDLAEQGLKSAQASVAKAQASLDKAREQLGYTLLKAEFDGVVTAISVETGQIVTAGQAVLKVAHLGERDVVVDVPEAQLGSLRLGTRFSIALQLDHTLRTSGALREIAPEADANTRTHRLKIALDEAPEVFRLNSIVAATAVGDDQSRSAIVLPVSAVLQKDGADRVWVIDPAIQTIALRPIQLAPRPAGASHVRVLTGLREGEEVAVAGIHELGEGQKVRLKREPRP